FPNGDTIMVDPFYAGHDYYSYVRKEAMFLSGSFENYAKSPQKFDQMARNNFEQKNTCKICAMEKGVRSYPITGVRARPMDKKENYVKRCIGLPGENLKIVNRQVMINDQAIENPKDMMYSYLIRVKSLTILDKIYKDFKVNISDRRYGTDKATEEVVGISSFTQEDYDKLKQYSGVISIEVNNDTINDEPLAIYPNSGLAAFSTWTRDNMGPIHIPAKGETIQLTPENIALYKRVIDVYENNDWVERDGGIFINGEAATSYTFKQDYYWMMGDNRHQSADSRYWGFVPEDHVVGKPVFTWFSKESPEYQETGEIRWGRMFRGVK
ncbi:MAG: S26 family signal peptidase, partial [Flavobacteriales bacterium]|nr:S26 family signal peptidase [Flavobacteriales bacterium]